MIRNNKFRLLLGFLASSLITFAGNPDRVGEAGATHLMFNPYARSSALHGANNADVRGIEATVMNPAGLIAVKSKEIVFARTNYLSGADIAVNAAGFATRLGGEEGTNVIGITFSSWDYGQMALTNTNSPEITPLSFTYSQIDLGFCFAHKFSESISAGAVVRTVSQGVPDARASGVALDAGINYTTGEYNQLKFGISLRNVGPRMQFSGDGLSVRAQIEGTDKTLTVENRSASFELPTALQIGASYDIIKNTEEKVTPHLLTAHASFLSNAFAYDNYMFALEYGFRNIVFGRVGYLLESGISSQEDFFTPYTGLSAGASVKLGNYNKPDAPQKGLVLDYSFRATRQFDGVHTFGVKVEF